MSNMIVARVAGGAALVFGVPHLVYHAAHLDLFDTTDVVANMVALSFAALAALVALAAPASGERFARVGRARRRDDRR